MTPLLLLDALKGVAVLLVASAASAAHAGALTSHITDAAGKPLVDAIALLEPVGAKAAVKPLADVEIAQAKREFSPRVTLITVGTRATFPNFDTVRHHVYSFSPNKTFEALPAGADRLRLWHPGMSGMPEPTVTAFTMTAGDADHHAKLSVSTAS